VTLHTRIAVLEPVPVKELFDWINTNLLGALNPRSAHKELSDFDIDHFRATQTGEKDERGVLIGERRWIPNGEWEYTNLPGQNLGAWHWITYRPDGPLIPKQLYYDSEHDETEEEVYWASNEGEEPYLHLANPAAALMIHFDTAYGFKGKLGGGCGSLHAAYIVKLADWFAQRGVGWSWYDEFAGDWHGEDLSALTKPYGEAHGCFGDPELGMADLPTVATQPREPKSIKDAPRGITHLGDDGGFEFVTRT